MKMHERSARPAPARSNRGSPSPSTPRPPTSSSRRRVTPLPAGRIPHLPKSARRVPQPLVEPGEGVVLHRPRELVRDVVEPAGELLAGAGLLVHFSDLRDGVLHAGGGEQPV